MSFISFLYSENKNVLPDTNKKNIYNSKSLQSSKNFEENDKETRQNKVKV